MSEENAYHVGYAHGHYAALESLRPGLYLRCGKCNGFSEVTGTITFTSDGIVHEGCGM